MKNEGNRDKIATVPCHSKSKMIGRHDVRSTEDHAQERPAQTNVVDGRTMKAHESKGSTQGNAP